MRRAIHRATAVLGLAACLCVVPRPVAAQEGGPGEATTYTVRSGDTLYRIALDHGMSVDELKALNDLEENAIQVGQVLVVEAGAPAQASGASDEAESERIPAPGTDAESGAAALFPSSYAGRAMAGGDDYDPDAYVISHRSLPLGSEVVVEHRAAGRMAAAVVADRGPVDDALLVEVSQALADTLHLETGDTVYLRIAE